MKLLVRQHFRLFFSALILLVFTQSIAVGQIKRDPRSVALAGSYGTIADGIFAVGYNPGLLAYQQDKPFMWQLVGFDLGFVGNYLSLSNMNAISGKTISKSEMRTLFDQYFADNGLTLYQDVHLPLPLLNFASGNMAITSNAYQLSNIGFAPGILELLLMGNAQSDNLDMTLNLEILSVAEYAFSFAVPYDEFALGVSFKYLQGLFYMGIDPDSSHASLTSTSESVYGGGLYYLRQGIGGGGLALDLGFATEEFNDGWRFGFSIVNALGKIAWNKPNAIKDFLAGSDNIYGNDDDLWHMTWGGETLSDSNAVRYTYSIDSLDAQSISDSGLFSNQQEVVYDLDSNGKLREFVTDYPTLVRFSVSKRYPDVLITSDLVTGLEDRFFARAHWRWSIGVESYKFPSVPLRFGFAWGGKYFKELGLGFGIHKGPLIFDMGLAFRNGIWIHTMKGLNLSTSLVITSFKSRKEPVPDAEESGPSPVPEE